MNLNAIETLGNKLGDAALRTLVRLYPQVRSATNNDLDAACAAMRTKSRAVIDELLDDAAAAPGISHIAFTNAALTLAHEGIRVLQTTSGIYVGDLGRVDAAVDDLLNL